MKFTSGKEQIDFDEEERKQKKAAKDKFIAEWAVDLVAKSDHSIPVVSKLKKGGGRAKVAFDTYRNVAEDMTMIFENNRDIFTSKRAADLAAHYIGRGILKVIFGQKKIKWASMQMGKYLEEIGRTTEKIHVEVGIISTFCDAVFKIYDAFKMGTLDSHEMDGMIKRVIKSLPENLKKLGKKKVEQMKAGSKVTDIYEHSAHGGKR